MWKRQTLVMVMDLLSLILIAVGVGVWVGIGPALIVLGISGVAFNMVYGTSESEE